MEIRLKKQEVAVHTASELCPVRKRIKCTAKSSGCTAQTQPGQLKAQGN